MPVKILRHDFAQLPPVELDLIVETIEKNRDRIRTSCGMLLTFAGILISFGTASLLFVAGRLKLERSILVFFAGALIGFVLVAVLAIASSFLRTRYAVSDKPQFVTDLLRLYDSELQLLRLSAGTMIVSLLLLTVGAVSLALQSW